MLASSFKQLLERVENARLKRAKAWPASAKAPGLCMPVLPGQDREASLALRPRTEIAEARLANGQQERRKL